MKKVLKILRILAVLLFLFGTAQAGDWSMFHHDLRHTGYTDEKISGDLELLWCYKTEYSIASSPAISNEKVFIGSGDNKIYCLDGNTGDLVWSYEAGYMVSCSSPAVSNGKAFVGSWDDKIYCLDGNTGKLIWSYKTGDWVDSSPALADGKVFVGSDDDKIYCLDEDTGNLVWSYKTGYSIRSSPALADGKVFVGSEDKKIYCLDEDTGDLIWSYETGKSVSSSPVVSKGKVFVGSNDDKIYCLDEDNGNLIWSFESGDNICSSPAIANDKVFVGSFDNKIYCLDEDTGDLIWSYETGNKVISSPAVADGKVFIGSTDNKIYCLDENTGDLIWSYETGNKVISSPAVADGKVFVCSDDGKIYCFGGKEQLTSASSTFRPEEVYVYLHGDKTDVKVGEEAILSLSTVNLITKPTMTLQLILKVPSGMSVSSAEFIESGAGQYTTTYTVEPGKERHIGVNIRTNQAGEFNVEGDICYYFGGDKSTAEYKKEALSVKVNPITTPTITGTTPTSSQTETPGFELIFAITGLLAVACFVKQKSKGVKDIFRKR